jgi:hypothetical protein
VESASWIQTTVEGTSLGLTRRLLVDHGLISSVSGLRLISDPPITFTRLWVSRSIRKIHPLSSHSNRFLEEIAFEPGSALEEIEENVFSGSVLKRMTIPKSVKRIGPASFEFCKNLCEVSFEEGSELERIEHDAFYSSSIVGIVLPASVFFVAGSAFVGVALDFVKVLSARIAVEDSFLMDVDNRMPIRQFGEGSDSVVIRAGVRALGESCCSKYETLRMVYFEGPCVVTRIGEKAFAWTALRSVLIPKSVEVLENLCFGWCRELAEVLFEEGSKLRRIEAAFMNCSLREIVLPREVREVDGSAFLGNEATLRSIQSLSPRIVMDHAFLFDAEELILIRGFARMTDFTCPSRVRVVGKACFSGNRTIERVTFEDGAQVGILGESAFYQSTIKLLVVPNTVVSLGKSCCYGCMLLTDVVFERESRLERIEESAFCMASLRRIEIPRSVRVLGRCCLSWCESLVEVVVEEGSRMERIEDDAFTMSQVLDIRIVHSPESQLSFNRPGCQITVVVEVQGVDETVGCAFTRVPTRGSPTELEEPYAALPRKFFFIYASSWKGSQRCDLTHQNSHFRRPHHRSIPHMRPQRRQCDQSGNISTIHARN